MDMDMNMDMDINICMDICNMYIPIDVLWASIPWKCWKIHVYWLLRKFVITSLNGWFPSTDVGIYNNK